MNKKAVFSFITLRTSGAYSWWDEFPIAIGKLLKQHGIDNIYFYRDYANNSRHSMGKRYTISHKEIKNPIKVKQIVGPIAKKYDKVIFHHHTPAFTSGLWIFSNKFRKKYHWITTEQDSWENIKFSSMKKRARIILRNLGFLPEIIIGNSNASKNRLIHLYGHEKKRFIYNGVKMPAISIPKPLKSIPNKALFVGRLEEYKGLWPLVEAFKLMKGKIDVKLTIAGQGPLYTSLLNYIKNHKLEKNVILLGHISNISDIIQKNHFSIVPSVYEEAFGLVSIEAQSYYLPCIYTNSGGLPETQINSKTGIMVSKNSPEEIVNGIKFFQEDIGRFNQICLNARQNAINFTMDKMAENYRNLYLELFKNENYTSI